MELMRNDAEAEWVFPNIACELLGCSDQTLRRKASEWGIRKRQYKGLSHRRYNRPDIERFLADNDARERAEVEAAQAATAVPGRGPGRTPKGQKRNTAGA